jgi:hypothetical protein
MWCYYATVEPNADTAAVRELYGIRPSVVCVY